MKAAIISLGSTSSKLVGEAMEKYFDQVDMLDLTQMEVRLGKDGGVFYNGEKLEEYDCVYLKGSFRFANLLRSIAALLQGKVPYMPLSESSFTTVHNKLLTHLVLEQNNIPMPKTYLSSSIDEAKQLLKRVNYPIVMKFPEGTQGKGVMFADSMSSASSMLDALSALNQPFIVQEFLETGGEDIRAFVVGDKVVASMKRVAQGGEKRANVHAGGKAESILLSHEATKIAIKTARVLGAEVCGVDILESHRGPLVIEANISPGLQGIQSVSTINIAEEIARYFARKTDEALHGKKKEEAKDVMNEISLDSNVKQKIITSLTFRGDRIILPVIANKIAKLKDDKEYALTLSKGKIEIEEN